MNITFVAHRLDRRGGQERSTHEILSRLQKKGHQIQVISFGLEDWDCDETYKTWHRVPGKNIPIQLLKNMWFSFYTFIYLTFNRPSFVITTGVSSWVADLRIVQFVHKKYLDQHLLGLAPLPNGRTIVHRIYQRIFAHWTVFLEKIFFNRTKHFVAISQRIKEEIEELLTDKNSCNIQIIHHAPDSSEYAEKKIPSEGTLKLLFVGALERKGIKKVLDTLALIKDKNWFLEVVGDGDLDRWRGYAKKLNIDKKLNIHGAKPSIPFFKEAHIFIFPSTYEPFGLVVSEAISYGALPFASRECGAMELWESRPEIMKRSANDGEQLWARSLSTLFDDRQLLQSLIADAKESILKRNWDIAANDYEKYFFIVQRDFQEIYT